MSCRCSLPGKSLVKIIIEAFWLYPQPWLYSAVSIWNCSPQAFFTRYFVLSQHLLIFLYINWISSYYCICLGLYTSEGWVISQNSGIFKSLIWTYLVIFRKLFQFLSSCWIILASQHTVNTNWSLMLFKLFFFVYWPMSNITTIGSRLYSMVNLVYYPKCIWGLISHSYPATELSEYFV